MKPWQRRILYDLAASFEDMSEWLRAKAERKPRSRPLRFPTDFELTMQRITDAAMVRYAEDLLGFSGAIWKNIPYRDGGIVPNLIKIRDDA